MPGPDCGSHGLWCHFLYCISSVCGCEWLFKVNHVTGNTGAGAALGRNRTQTVLVRIRQIKQSCDRTHCGRSGAWAVLACFHGEIVLRLYFSQY